MTYTSLSTIEQRNNEKFMEWLRKLDPELYVIKLTLMETGVNPFVLPKIIRALGNLAIGTGFGAITIFMKQTIVTQVKGEESDIINERAVVDE